MSDCHWFAALVPYRFRGVHRWFAEVFGYFWIPCPMCGEPFGGHEWRNIDGKSGTIPAPDRGPGSGHCICPTCTRAGRGVLTYP